MNTTYNITVSNKSPVTVWYNGHGVVPSRTIAYRTVKIKRTEEKSRYGWINYANTRVPVKSTRQNARGVWSQWEAIKLIDPFAHLRRDNDATTSL